MRIATSLSLLAMTRYDMMCLAEFAPLSRKSLSFQGEVPNAVRRRGMFLLLPASLRSATLLNEEGFFTSQSVSLTAPEGEPRGTRANTIRPYGEE